MPPAPLSPDEAQRLAAVEALRAPVDGILAMSATLMLSGLSEDQLRYARTIDASARRLLTEVNQIIDTSKNDAKAAPLQHIPFSLPGLIDDVAAPVSVRAREKGLELGRFVAQDVPARLSGDPERLRQILAHLLDNAVKFTEAGEIRLDVRAESRPGESPEAGIFLRFTVIDTGIGLRPEASAGIFDADTGLAASRQIVQLMGGDIHVHSMPGEGATFWFTARFVPAAAGSPPPAPASRPLRFLIAEDNTVNQLILSEQLSQLGHTFLAVRNGIEALKALEESAWDAVLLDCQMPLLDGYDTVRAIRRTEAATGSRRLWVVAVTANALEGEREACLGAGMDDFLSKPFQVQQLAQIIARIPLLAEESGSSRAAVDASLLATLAESKAVNGENLLDRMAGLFTESGPPMLDQMDQALSQDDFTAAIRAAHKLAGGCSYFGAETLYALCTDFERLGRQGDHTAIRSLAPRIRHEYGRVELALRHNRPSPPS